MYVLNVAQVENRFKDNSVSDEKISFFSNGWAEDFHWGAVFIWPVTAEDLQLVSGCLEWLFPLCNIAFMSDEDHMLPWRGNVILPLGF